MSSAAREQSVIDSVARKLLIGGEWRDASGGASFDVDDPSTGETLCEVADGTPDDARAAMNAAVEAQAEWAVSPPNDRSKILHDAFELMAERIDDLARSTDLFIDGWQGVDTRLGRLEKMIQRIDQRQQFGLRRRHR